MDITEMNVCIARFMGGTLIGKDMIAFPDEKIEDDGSGSAGGIISHNRHISDLHYHDDWRWLMPVWEKLNSIYLSEDKDEFLLDVRITPNKCYVIDSLQGNVPVTNENGATNKEMVFIALYETIVYLNKQYPKLVV